MSKISLKPTHKVIDGYYTALHNYNRLGFFNEGSVSPPFAILLESAAKQVKWNLVQQYPKKSKGKSIRIDGAVVDQWGLPHGYWEADHQRPKPRRRPAIHRPADQKDRNRQPADK